MRLSWLFSLMVTSLCICEMVEDDCQCNLTGNKCTCAQNQYSLEGERFLRVHIKCNGTKLTCTKFPSKQFSKNGTLKRLIIKNCSLDDSISCLLRKMSVSDVGMITLLDFLTPLRKQHVEGLLLPTAFKVFDGKGIQSSIPYDVISALPNLIELKLKTTKVAFRPNLFQAPKLNFLELIHDSIEEIPPGTFQGLDQLVTLDLWNNSIRSLHKDSFQGLSNLRSLFLDLNMLSSISADILAHMPLLKEIRMHNNPLSLVQNGLFQGLAHLEEVTISTPRPLILESEAFSNLPNLTNLLLEVHLKDLPHTVFLGSTKLTVLNLRKNEIELLHPHLFRDQVELSTLNLSHNKIKSLTEELFRTLKKLLLLDLSFNAIEVFPDGLFGGLTTLQTLDASNNNLKHIGENAFRGTPILNLLLYNNQLSFRSMDQYTDLASSSSSKSRLLDTGLPGHCDSEVFKEMRVDTKTSISSMVKCKSLLTASVSWRSPLTKLTKLMKLDLMNNTIRNIFDIWPNVTSLWKINLAYNNIDKLSYAEMALLNELTVDLSYNQITTIHIDELFIKQTGSMILYDNPFNCDCSLHSFLKVANSSKRLIIDESVCSQPLRLIGFKLSKLDLAELVCEYPKCTPECDCFERPAVDRLDMHCTSLIFRTDDLSASNKKMKKYLKLDQDPINFEDLKLNNVKEIDLSGLGLTELHFKDVPKSVSFLNLSHNYLGYLPSELLSRNVTFALSNNFLACDCAHEVEMNEIVRNIFKIVDFSNILCSDGTFMNQLDVNRLCILRLATTIGVSFAILGMICIIIAVIIYKYSFELKIFTSRYLPCLISEEEYDASKVYDVFISYAHEDDDFVRDRLLPKLENSPNCFKTCIHSRDWLAGDTIPYNIAKSVEQSRRTIIVLSENFLKSMWALLEFRAAHVQAAKEGRARVIVILLEDVTVKNNLDKEIKAYLSTNTYVKWGDPWFWDKLVYALPKRGRLVDSGEEKRLQAAAHELVKSLDGQSNNERMVDNEQLAITAL